MRSIQIKFACEVDAHNRSEVTTVIQNPYQQNQIISIGHDSFIRVWNKNDLSMVSSHRIISPYLMCITPFNGKFLMGIGNGNLVVLSNKFQIQQQISLHEDCITAIIITANYIITTSYDGKINFINKQTFAVEKSKQLERPIFQCLNVNDDYLYIAANPSVKMNLNTQQTVQIGHYLQFIAHHNKIYGCSDENGITCLDQNKQYHIPCQYMVSMGDFILCSSEQGVGLVYQNEQEQEIWEVKFFQQLQKGCSILSGFSKVDQVFVVGESGNIYKFKVVLEDKAGQKQKNHQFQQDNLIASQN